MPVKVAIQRCAKYSRDLVFEAVHQALEPFGGIGRIVGAGKSVLLKPNMLSAKTPDRAITTHPMVLEALIEEIRTTGAEVWMGDSPGGAINRIDGYWEATGFRALAERTGIRLINFEIEEKVVREIGGIPFHVAKAMTEADVIINVPKFKTHGLTLYTGAVKNLMGVLPGFQKVRIHKLYPHPTHFSRFLVEIYLAVRPHFHLMDGILGMGGNGPSTGDKREIGLILGSSDGIALDAVASRIMGFQEEEVDVVRWGRKLGAGEGRLDHIDIVGEDLQNIHLEDFPLPSNRAIRMVPQWLGRAVGRFIWVRPEVNVSKCTGCGLCARSCPVQAIEMVDGHAEMDYKTCINCLCCNECCPEEAVFQNLSRLTRMFT